MYNFFAIYRLKYPFMFDMALGASAPIFMTYNVLNNPYLFFEVVTNSTRRINPKCVDLVRLGFEQLQSASNDDITSKLNLCSSLSNDKNDGLYEIEAMLFQIWADLAMNDYPPSVSPIISSCNAMINASNNMTDGIDAFNALLEPFWEYSSSISSISSINSNPCLNLTSKTLIPSGKNGKIHCSDLTGCGNGPNGESWDYQACQQDISPMATQNSDINMFAPNWDWNLTWLANHCQNRFNLNKNSVFNRKHWMKNSMGLDRDYFWNDNVLPFITSNIIFSNGIQDGWHAGGQLTNFTNSDTLVAIIMQNGAHHSDLKAQSQLDTDDVLQARDMEINLLTKWYEKAKQQRLKRKKLNKRHQFATVSVD